MHRWMWNLQFGGLNNDVANQQDIDVERAWAFGNVALASEIRLDLSDRGQQLLWCLRRLQLKRTVQEPGLLPQLHRLGFVERRDAAHCAHLPQPIDAGVQVRLAVTQIRSEGKINNGFLPR